ncbi:MAG: glutathione S-transferase [Verrucomicrobia bacterium]|nr:MAG: glutathione S-transferase [Verrucomicrobiota bacterium]
MITLYQIPHSPFCIPIRLILDAAKVPFETLNVTNANRHELITLTNGAYYQVPVILDERTERRIVFESGPSSQDVARYLNEEFTGGRLFPSKLDGLQDVLLHHLEEEVEALTFKLYDPFYVDSETDLVERVMMIRHKERKFGKGCVERWRNDRSEMLNEAVQILLPYEKMLQYSPFLLGDKPVYTDFLLAGILGNISYAGKNSLPETIPLLGNFTTKVKAFSFD